MSTDNRSATNMFNLNDNDSKILEMCLTMVQFDFVVMTSDDYDTVFQTGAGTC